MPPDSQQLRQAMILHAKDVVCITNAAADASQAIVYVNDAFTQLTGFSAEEAIGRSPRMLQGPRTCRSALARIRAGLIAGQPVREELINYAKDGHSYWLDIDIFPTTDDAGRITHFVAIERDITAQKRAETSARAAEGMLALMLAGVAASVLVLDEQGRINMANGAMARLSGWPIAELITHRVEERLAADDATRTALRDIEGDETEARHDAMRIRGRDGAIIEVDASTVALRHSDGRRLRVVTMLAAATAGLLTTVPGPPPADRDPPPLASSRLQLVRLDSIREALGDRWEADRASVRGRAERIARLHLAPHDIIERVGDDGLLICFADLSADQSAARAEVIRREIERMIMGQPEAASPVPVLHVVPKSAPALAKPAVGAVSEIAAALGQNGMSERREKFAGGWQTAERETALPAAAGTIAPAILARLEQSQAALEGNWRRIAAHALEHSAVVLHPVRGSDGRAVPMAMASLPTGVARSLGQYRTNLAAEGGVEADCLLLSRAAELVVAAVRTGDSALVIVPVTYATLDGRHSGAQYLDVCQSIRDHIRRYLLIDVRAIPADAARSRLEDLLGTLRSHARGVGISLSGAETHLIEGWQTPVQIVSLEHAAVCGGEGAPNQILDNVTRMAHRQRARVLVRNLPDSADAAPLRRAGVDLLTSIAAAA